MAGLWLHHFVIGQQQPASFNVRLVSYRLLEVKRSVGFVLVDNANFLIILGSLHFSTVNIVVGACFGRRLLAGLYTVSGIYCFGTIVSVALL